MSSPNYNAITAASPSALREFLSSDKPVTVVLWARTSPNFPPAQRDKNAIAQFTVGTAALDILKEKFNIKDMDVVVGPQTMFHASDIDRKEVEKSEVLHQMVEFVGNIPGPTLVIISDSIRIGVNPVHVEVLFDYISQFENKNIKVLSVAEFGLDLMKVAQAKYERENKLKLINKTACPQNAGKSIEVTGEDEAKQGRITAEAERLRECDEGDLPNSIHQAVELDNDIDEATCERTANLWRAARRKVVGEDMTVSQAVDWFRVQLGFSAEEVKKIIVKKIIIIYLRTSPPFQLMILILGLPAYQLSRCIAAAEEFDLNSPGNMMIFYDQFKCRHNKCNLEFAKVIYQIASGKVSAFITTSPSRISSDKTSLEMFHELCDVTEVGDPIYAANIGKKWSELAELEEKRLVGRDEAFEEYAKIISNMETQLDADEKELYCVMKAIFKKMHH